jgi:hypothetical protein
MCSGHGDQVEKRMVSYESNGRYYDIRQRLICGENDLRCTTTVLPKPDDTAKRSITTVTLDTVIEHMHNVTHDQGKHMLYKEELQRAVAVISLL